MHRNHGDGTHKEEQQRHEQAHGADVDSPIPGSGRVMSPRRWQEIAMQTGDHDYKSLQPHADVHDDTHHPKHYQIGADLLEPKELRSDNVTENQSPVVGAVRPEHPVIHHEPFVRIRTVMRVEDFHHVAVAHNQAGGQHDLGHIIDMPHGDQ